MPPDRSSCAGESYWLTCPLSMTSTLSKSMMVLRRCAMVMTVESAKARRMVPCTSVSVVKSTDAVASSMMMTRGFLSSTRARHTSCTVPLLRFEPFSST